MNLPPLRILHTTLCGITERLAHELAEPTATAPDWSDAEWPLARAVAAMHGVSPLLATHLKWEGPAGWKPFLESQRTHVATRHRRIVELLDQLDARCREEGVAIVGLKGSALHGMGLYRAGERPMADVDLLVHPDQANRAAAVLESLGYGAVPSMDNWKHRNFLPQVREVHNGIGEHSRNYLKIELHERIAEALPLRIYDVTTSVYPSTPHPGLNAYPSKAALLIHLLIHAAGSMPFRTLRLLHLHDIALVASRMSEADWESLLKGNHWWALPPIQLVARYYRTAVPTAVLAALADHCAWNLRRRARHQTLSEVSFSYLWIEAFPGIGWCQSPAEALQCIRNRILPDAEVRHLRKVIVKDEVAMVHSEWGHLTQRQRILRWMLSRQARPNTLHAVQAAIAQPMS
jgi:putative nucleotidyltransferase-like protein